jgi:2-dehydro-3-deoxyphosphogluconate aldolase/(4S)-4-hydroxy-2-oxoglutarate aldolase
MWKKLENLKRIADGGLVVIIRNDDAQETHRIAEACIEGGIRALEITMSVPKALRVIETLADKYRNTDVVIGAGTILDAETARAAILAGADLLVSPHLNVDMIRVCNRYQAVSIVGAMTPKDAVEAMEAGADIVKLFPAEFLGAPYVKTIMAPLPQVPFVPTGKATPQNVSEWFQAGCIAVGVGSYITKAAGKEGDYQKVSQAAREFVAAVANARQ